VQLERLGKFMIDGLFNLFTGNKGELDKRTAAINSLPEINQTGAPLDGLTNFTKNQVNLLGKFYIPDGGAIFKNSAGNSLGNLLATVGAEQAAMPSGSSIAIANSSEAILTRGQSQVVASALTNKVGASIGNVNVYVSQPNATAVDIGLAVRNQLIALLD
jgi:hypothetical protein